MLFCFVFLGRCPLEEVERKVNDLKCLIENNWENQVGSLVKDSVHWQYWQSQWVELAHQWSESQSFKDLREFCLDCRAFSTQQKNITPSYFFSSFPVTCLPPPSPRVKDWPSSWESHWNAFIVEVNTHDPWLAYVTSKCMKRQWTECNNVTHLPY